ncbi:hypothetical protein K1T71_005038 [Dendrolimus kikuchii]|uniref:Uncharacterized protein n=1 Tax=Dendrolimus kikuchii TaxID=765133 RepID=A0ACC1D5V2_9NEOP|nr:hypothetical protein K1T71_005038 [Dendrolimus kikuchii]
MYQWWLRPECGGGLLFRASSNDCLLVMKAFSRGRAMVSGNAAHPAPLACAFYARGAACRSAVQLRTGAGERTRAAVRCAARPTNCSALRRARASVCNSLPLHQCVLGVPRMAIRQHILVVAARASAWARAGRRRPSGYFGMHIACSAARTRRSAAPHLPLEIVRSGTATIGSILPQGQVSAAPTPPTPPVLQRPSPRALRSSAHSLKRLTSHACPLAIAQNSSIKNLL